MASSAAAGLALQFKYDDISTSRSWSSTTVRVELLCNIFYTSRRFALTPAIMLFVEPDLVTLMTIVLPARLP